MIRRYFLKLVNDESRDPVSRLLQTLLWLLSGIYGAVLVCRETRVRFRAVSSGRLGCPVVSVGNLTWGGTGKTPLVRFLVPRLKGLGFRPGVISRAGEDEVALLREVLDGVPVAVGADRLRMGRRLIEQFGTDVLVLDDGFQERRLEKDLEIVVLNGRNPFGNGSLIPRGILREPVSRLCHAQWVLINKVDTVTAEEKSVLRSKVQAIHRHVPVAESVYRVTEITPLWGGEALPVAQVRGEPVAILAAIADPASFSRTVRDLGARIVQEVFLPDHHVYTKGLMARIQTDASAAGARRILVTEKDAVKIKPLFASGVVPGPPVFAVGIRLEITKGEEELGGLLRALRPR